MNWGNLPLLAAAVLAIGSNPADAAPNKPFDPRPYQRVVAGQPTSVMVLGSPHLSGTPEGWNAEVLEPLLEKVAAFDPDVITIEALSGQSFSKLWAYRPVFGTSATDYGSRLMTVAAAGAVGTGMDMAQAEAEVRKLLLSWPAAPSPAQRRRLAALFAASGDPHSALVQWWRLDEKERRAGDGVTRALVAQLGELETRRNENHLIGSRLAARLGLERVHPVDEQDDDVFSPEQASIFAKDVFPPLVARMRAHPQYKRVIEATSRLGTTDELMTAYRVANDPASAQLQADLEWRGVIDRPTAGDVGRVRTAGWEVRNLRMAANIRQAMAARPGSRVLVIVGSGHKSWLEAYLSMMSDVRIVDAASVLK